MGYFRVTNPLPSVYHLEDIRGVFATLLLGSKQALLVDTAMGIGNIAKEVRMITELPLTVVNTHGHIDHTL
ncbi:MAG: MBL fold metallo-hydrolase, partial [Bacillota bacterium]